MDIKKSIIPITIYLIGIFILQKSCSAQEPDTKTHYKAPKFIFEVCGAFDDPTGSSSGNVRDFFTFDNYGCTYGLGFQFNIKYAANNKAFLYPFITGGFTQLQNDDHNSAYIDSNKITGGYPLSSNTQYNSTPGTSLIIFRNFYAGAGLQYYFSSKGHFLPFAGLELLYNYIWGYYIQNPAIVEGNDPGGQTTFNINGASRFGFGINLGTEYRISKHLGFVLGANYRLTNLLGKQSERSNDINTMNLLDKEDLNLNAKLNKSRNIEHLEFYLGFAIFAGTR
jgi:Outer membrane protein beta-barrel domain